MDFRGSKKKRQRGSQPFNCKGKLQGLKLKTKIKNLKAKNSTSLKTIVILH